MEDVKVSSKNPNNCTPSHICKDHDATHVHGPSCGHEKVIHGDHSDYKVGNHLHHPHEHHCDNHGVV